MNTMSIRDAAESMTDDLEWVTMPVGQFKGETFTRKSGERVTITEDKPKKAFISRWSELTESKPVFGKKNVGVITGEASNLTVLDIDTGHRGLEIWERIKDLFNEAEMAVPCVRTGGGGLHFYFQFDHEIITGAELVMVDYGEEHSTIGIDIRSEGGMVVAPPSIHDSGNTYEWLTDPYDCEVGPMPAKLKELVLGRSMLKLHQAKQTFSIVKNRYSMKKPKVFGIEEKYDIAQSAYTEDEVHKIILDNIPSVTIGERKGNMIILGNVGNRKCIINGEDNLTDNSFVIWGEKGLYFGCHDASCKNQSKCIAKLGDEKQKCFDTVHDEIIAEALAEEKALMERFEGKDEPQPTDADDEPEHNFRYSDWRKFANKSLDGDLIMDYLKQTIIHVINGGDTQLFTKRIDAEGVVSYGSIKTQPFSRKIEKFPVKYKHNICMIDALFQTSWQTYNYDQVDFVPYHIRDPTPPRVFNMFNGFRFPFRSIPEYKEPPQSIDKILYHMEHIICGGNKASFEYLTNWCAHMFQKPAEKVGTAVLLASYEEGTGKNTFTNLLMQVLGKGLYWQSGSIDSFIGNFNLHLQGKLLHIANELANYAGYNESNKLKTLITEDTINIEPKGVDPYEIHDYSRMILTSNSDKPIRVNEHDRRYFPLKISTAKLGNQPYFNALLAQTKSTESQRAFYDYLCNRDISDFDPRDIPYTELKTELVMDNLDTAIMYFIETLKGIHNTIHVDFAAAEDGRLKVRMTDLFRNYTEWVDENKMHGLLAKREFSKSLKKKLGVSAKTIRDNGESYWGYDLREKALKDALVKHSKNPKLFVVEGGQNNA